MRFRRISLRYPALNAKNEGYDVQVIGDASGSGTKMGDDFALDRMRQADIAVASTIQILSEMVAIGQIRRFQRLWKS